MLESTMGPGGLYTAGSALGYSQATMMGSLPDAPQLGYPGPSAIPNIILTGEVWAGWGTASGLQGPP